MGISYNEDAGCFKVPCLSQFSGMVGKACWISVAVGVILPEEANADGYDTEPDDGKEGLDMSQALKSISATGSRQ